MFNLMKKNKGFTLVELIISIAILSIVLTAVFSFFNYSNRVFSMGTQKSELQGDTRNTIDYINRQVGNATSLNIMPMANCLSEVASPTTSSNYEYLYIQGDKLYYYKNTGSPAKVIASNIDAANSRFEKVYDNTLSFKMQSNLKGQVYSTETRMALQNFALMKPASYIVGLSSGTAIRYTKDAISISPIPVASVTATPVGGSPSISTDQGTLQFTADVQPYDAKNKDVTWTVDYTGIGLASQGLAFIDSNGLLKAVKNGLVNVIAKANEGPYQSSPIMVVISGQSPVKVSGIAISSAEGTTSISKSSQLQFSAAASPDYADNKNVTWSVSPVVYGSITSTGLFNPDNFPNGGDAPNSILVIIRAEAADGGGAYASFPLTITKN